MEQTPYQPNRPWGSLPMTEWGPPGHQGCRPMPGGSQETFATCHEGDRPDPEGESCGPVTCSECAGGGDRTPVEGEMCARDEGHACETDADCAVGGCGGELCYNPDLGGGGTTCDCTAPAANCGCVDGTCADEDEDPDEDEDRYAHKDIRRACAWARRVALAPSRLPAGPAPGHQQAMTAPPHAQKPRTRRRHGRPRGAPRAIAGGKHDGPPPSIEPGGR
jgi:hypothetical protein